MLAVETTANGTNRSHRFGRPLLTVIGSAIAVVTALVWPARFQHISFPFIAEAHVMASILLWAIALLSVAARNDVSASAVTTLIAIYPVVYLAATAAAAL